LPSSERNSRRSKARGIRSSATPGTAGAGRGTNGHNGQGKGSALFILSGATLTGSAFATFSGSSASDAAGGGTDTNDVYSTACTTTAVTSSANPTVVGHQVTYTATVTPAPDGGTVIFEDGPTTISGCGSQAVDNTDWLG
jgi:hypothetical protein